VKKMIRDVRRFVSRFSLIFRYYQERAVTRLLDVIAQDKRHKAIVMENMEIVHERRFQDWGGMALTEVKFTNWNRFL